MLMASLSLSFLFQNGFQETQISEFIIARKNTEDHKYKSSISNPNLMIY